MFSGEDDVFRGDAGLRQSLACLVVLLVCAVASWAQAASLIDFDVPAQPLDQALHAFGRQSTMAVLVDRELTVGRRSMPLQGRFTAREGLRRLLEGTGLQAHYSSAQAFTVQPMRLPPRQQGRQPVAAPATGSYALAIQQAVERTLCRSPLTRPGGYRAALQLWIDMQGRVVQTRLLASTGELPRDTALIEALRALRLARQPPGALAQPVTLLLRPGKSTMDSDCMTTQGASAV